MSLSEAELVERSGASVGRIRGLVELGVLRPEEGRFRPPDVQRVRIAEALDRAGIPSDHLGWIVSEGYFWFEWQDVLFPDPVPLSDSTIEGIAADLDVPAGFLERALALWQVAVPAPGDRLREDDAELLRMVAETYEILGRDEARTVAATRYFGDNVRRIAESQIHWFRRDVEDPAIASGVPQAEIFPVVTVGAGRLMPMAERVMMIGYRRHLEHAIVQDVVENVELSLERAGLAPPGGKNPPAIAFLDISGYTTLTEEQGDAAAADLAQRIAEEVSRAAATGGGRAVKFLGDGVMFHFPAARGAVECGLDLVERLPALGLPRVHVGVSAGPVVHRDGDYFGRTVNVAARIGEYARPGEVLVSEDVVSTRDSWDLAFEEIGPVSLKGLPAPVTVHRVSRGRS